MARKSIPAHPHATGPARTSRCCFAPRSRCGRMIGSLQRQLDIATGRLDGFEAEWSRSKEEQCARWRAKDIGSTEEREEALNPGPPAAARYNRARQEDCHSLSRPTHRAIARAPHVITPRTLSTTPTCCNHFSATRRTFLAARRLGLYSRRTSTRSRRLSRPPSTSSLSARNRH